MAKTLHCGEEPGECGKFSDAVAEHDIEMVIPIGTGTRQGNCYVGTSEVRQRVAYYRIEGGGSDRDMLVDDVRHIPVYETYVVKGSGQSYPWTLVPFNMGVRAKLVLSYNSQGHLIATLKNIRSAVLDAQGSVTRQGTYPYCTAGDFGFALVATLSTYRPSDGYSGWNKCFGGWWSGSRSCDSNSCYAGCTYYKTAVWNDFGSKYSHSGAHPTRRDDDYSWDLGVIDDPARYNVFIYGRAVRGNCTNARFEARDGTSVSQNFDVPPLNICPPSIDAVEMKRDICESTVNAELTITIPELGMKGIDLYVGWVAANSESEALSHGSWQTKIIEDVTEKTTITVPLDSNLIPNTTYYFRAYLTNGAVSSDTVLSCNNKTLYMPAASCVVPMLSAEECEELISGECLVELTEEDEEVCCG